MAAGVTRAVFLWYITVMKKQIAMFVLFGFVGCVPVKPEPIIVDVSLPSSPLPSSPLPSSSPSQQVIAKSQSEIDIRVSLPAPSPSPQGLPTPIPSPVPIRVESVTIETAENTPLESGKSLNLKAEVVLSDQSKNSAVLWSSDAPQIASINSMGTVQAHQAGQVTLSAQSQIDPSKSAHLHLVITLPVVNFKGKIVYAANQDFYLLQGSNQNPVRLTQSGSLMVKKIPRFSWDGREIVFSSYQNAIFRLNITPGSEPQEITGVTPNLREPFPYFGLDGSLYFQAIGAPNFEKDGEPRVWRKTADAKVEVLTNKTKLVSYLGGITPQGLMVYEEDSKVKILDLPNASEPKIVSPGGDVHLPLHPTPEFFVYGLEHDLYLSNFKGEVKRLTQTGFSESQASLSPDQTQIVFISNRTGNAELYLMNRDGSGITQLTFTPEISESGPDWGP